MPGTAATIGSRTEPVHWPLAVPGRGSPAPGETADRLMRTGLLTAAAVHEVNNLICAVQAHAEIGLASAEPDLMRYCLQAVRDAATDMGAWFRGVLDFVRGRPIRIEETDVSEVIGRALALLRPILLRSRVDVVREEAGVPPVLASESHLRQVLVNLCLNACHALASGGGRLSIRLRSAGGGVECELEDDGPGMPAEVLAAIFEPFASGSEGGAGLGLYVTRTLVQAMGGDIKAASRPGDGAVFTLWLPCVQSPQTAHHPGGNGTPGSSRG